MRLLLDAKDLINLVVHRTPVSLVDFSNWLNQRSAKLVLTAMNVSELVAPLKEGGDFLEIRVLLQAMERSPVCYLREKSTWSGRARVFLTSPATLKS
jgi:hypothetical protein